MTLRPLSYACVCASLALLSCRSPGFQGSASASVGERVAPDAAVIGDPSAGAPDATRSQRGLPVQAAATPSSLPMSAGRGGSESSAAGMSAAGGGGAEAPAGAAGAAGAAGQAASVPSGAVLDSLDISEAWAGHPVSFALLTKADRQYVAFYDAARALTVASRSLHERSWKLVRLSSQLGWDSHNAVVIALDGEGFIHVAGNMHSSPLSYFRSREPWAPETLEKVSAMVGMDEQSCTYPRFFLSSNAELIFMYRSGSSGNGDHIFNRYELASRSWRRLLSSALTDGEGQRNAYPVGPTQGPKKDWHLVWVWRDTPDASTNHDLSYAATRDLVSWHGADGRELSLPIRLQTSDIVDPVPAGAGMINNNTQVGFDAEQRPIVSYHKYDNDGNTQLYNARFENGAWVVHQTSKWSYRWEFGGGGTLVFDIRVDPVELQSDGTLVQRYFHRKLGGEGAFRLNATTLAVEETIAPPLPYPAALDRPEGQSAGLEVHWQADSGAGDDASLRYMLRWETLPENRDMPRDQVPPPSTLRLYTLQR